MGLALLVMTGVFLLIAVRLVAIQGVSANHLLKVGLAERTRIEKLAGQRGTIFDRQGNELAVSIPQQTVWADPAQVRNPLVAAAALAPVLGVDQPTLVAELSQPTQFVYLARTIPDAEAAKVTALKLVGVYTEPEAKRFDPAGSVASPLVGTVGTDGTGLSGLEAEYQKTLSGQDGTRIQQVDPNGNPIPGGLQQFQPAVNGQDLVLTIDEPLQAQTEQALAGAITSAKAQSGMAAVMDTSTGELLAVASLSNQSSPGKACDPTTPGAAGIACSPMPTSSSDPFTTVFEPGSMSKVVTISEALQDGVVVPSDDFSVPDTLQVADTTFHDAESHPVEHWSVTDILANSSNVGTITIAQQLGPERLDQALASYGYGNATGVGFPGESAGLVPSLNNWSGTSLATIAVGQGVAVTAIQMLAAYNTIANGGVYVAPKLVAATVDTNGQQHRAPPSPQRQVVSPQVAAEMNTMLGEVVRVGTGASASVPGYAVAGKTGTALVPLPGARGYQAGVYASSFAGFVPAGHPQLTTIVVIDQTPLFGAVAAAPTFSAIAGDALRDFRIPPGAAPVPAPGVPQATTQTAQAAGETIGPTSVAAVPTHNPAASAQATTTTMATHPGMTTPTTAPRGSPAAPSTTEPPTTTRAGATTTTRPAGH